MADAPVADAPAREASAGEVRGHAAPADPHAAIVAELRARFGDGAAGPAVAIYLAARGYDAAQVAAVLARLAGARGDDVDAAPGVQSPGMRPVSPATGGVDRTPAAESPLAELPLRQRLVGEPSAGEPSVAGPPPRPLRAWAPHERARFTAEAWGRLLQLRASGLGDHEFEHLVDRALLQLDGPVTLAELRALLGDALGPGDAAPATLH